MVMPGMPGLELARKVLTLRPETRIMCMSGYTDRPLEIDELAPSPVLLQKPFKLRTLAQELRNVLDHKLATAHA
jgi:FixJ family two-component response regulator